MSRVEIHDNSLQQYFQISDTMSVEMHSICFVHVGSVSTNSKASHKVFIARIEANTFHSFGPGSDSIVCFIDDVLSSVIVTFSRQNR